MDDKIVFMKKMALLIFILNSSYGQEELTKSCIHSANMILVQKSLYVLDSKRQATQNRSPQNAKKYYSPSLCTKQLDSNIKDYYKTLLNHCYKKISKKEKSLYIQEILSDGANEKILSIKSIHSKLAHKILKKMNRSRRNIKKVLNNIYSIKLKRHDQYCKKIVKRINQF
jgi:hypothetical protein